MSKDSEELIPDNSKFPLPAESQIMVVTPQMASDWLSYRSHATLRPLNREVSARYQRDMKEGRWREGTPEGYIFDEQGYIISARHRLKAQANGNHTLNMWVFVDQPRSISTYVDAGFRRTAGHLINGKYNTSAATAARMLAALADGDQYGTPRHARITVPEVVEAYEKWPEISWYVRDAWAAYQLAHVTPGPHLAVLAQAARSPHRDLIPAWCLGVQRGANLNAGDPRLQVRHRFSMGLKGVQPSGRRDMAYALLVKGWNAFVQGQRISVLRWSAAEPLPVMIDAPSIVRRTEG